MAIAITIPRLDWSMEEGTFVEWRKRDGDPVKPGDFIYVLESEKAAQEIEALDAGILRIPPHAPKPGEVVKVGQVIGFLAAAGESVAALDVGSPSMPAATSKAAADAALQKATPVAGPALRRLARSLAVDITNVV